MSFSIKSLFPRTLFGRSLMILVTPVLLIQVITTFFFFDSHWSKMTDRLAFAVSGEIAIIADQINSGADAERVQLLTGYAAQKLDLLVSYKADEKLDENEFVSARHSIVASTLDRSLAAQMPYPYSINVDIEEKWVEVSLQLDAGLLRVSLPQRRLFSSSGYIFLLWMIGSSIILLAVAIIFMRNQIRPIRRLAVVAERFGKGQGIPISFKPEGAKEIRQASRSFIEMHERIKRQVEQRMALLSGVSHDLRTPLTRMKLQTAMLEQSPDVEALQSDINDMQRMVDAYLDFARGQGGEQVERVDVKDMLEQVVQDALRQGGVIDLNVVDDISASLRPIAFKRCLTNVINNARKYADHVWVCAEADEHHIQVTVDDDGPGIAPEQYEDVFKPFYRVESSRNPATGGVGLGLPIAQDVMLSHGGNIILSESEHGGLRVVMTLPV